MDFAKLNPWNWFKKEEEREQALPARTESMDAGEYDAPARLVDLHSEIDRLFEDSFRGFGLSPALRRRGRSGATGRAGEGFFKPRVDISGSEKEYVITAELPGVDEKDIALEIRGDSLVIRAEKRREEKSEDKGYYRVERGYGSFQRVLAIPDDADAENVKAKHKNGVLTVTLPRKQAVQANTRRVPIEA